ncbi:MAG: VOC family protein [Sphingomonas sp.]|nr:VOC family protein [Sphingomonas sp.]
MVTNVLQITPFMQVRELAPAIAFFVDILGFTLGFQADNYAYVSLDGAGIRILENDCPEELGQPHRGFAYYIDVRNLAAVQTAIGDRLATLSEGDVIGPIDQPYGQRELIIRAPDGNLLVFGQAIA